MNAPSSSAGGEHGAAKTTRAPGCKYTGPYISDIKRSGKLGTMRNFGHPSSQWPATSLEAKTFIPGGSNQQPGMRNHHRANLSKADMVLLVTW